MYIKSGVLVAFLISILGLGMKISAAEKDGLDMKAKASIKVYIGTYTHAGSRGIYLSELDRESGILSEPVLAAELDAPGFLKYDTEGHILYSTGNPAGAGKQLCSAAAFNVENDGRLDLINTVTVKDLKMCHINRTANLLVGADYGHAKAAVFSIGPDGGISDTVAILTYSAAEGAVPERQASPHVHSINPDISGRYLFVCDFSGDAVRVYEIDSDSKQPELVSSASVAAGSGPRHLVCHPNGKYVYVINELNGTIVCFGFNGGKLQPFQTAVTLPEDYKKENTTAEIAISPDRNFIYATNRGHDSIAYYRINQDSGELSIQGIVPTEGEHPRNFTIDPSGQFILVSNRDSGNVVVFRIERDTGCPVYSGNQVKLSLPMCVVFAGG